MHRPASVTLTMDTEAADVAAALDLLRRVRMFAEEVSKVPGVDVTMEGSINVVVRAKAGPEAPTDIITPVGDVSPEEARRLAKAHAAKVAGVEAADA
jgi:hypothetical protein